MTTEPSTIVHPPDRRVEGIRTLAAICIVIASLKLASDLLVPVLLAAFFAMALTPLAERLHRAGVPATLATLLSFALGAVLVLGLGALVAHSMQDIEEALPRYEAKIETGVEDATAWLQGHGIAVPENSFVDTIDPDKAVSFATGVVGSLGKALSDSVVVLFVMLLLMFEGAALSRAVPGVDPRQGAKAKLQQVVDSVTGYLSVKTIISLLTGLFFGIACALIGVDFPVLWGLLAFLLNYIPTVGSVLAAIPAVLVALVQLGIQGAVLVLVATVVVNGILGNVIEPKMMGQKVGLSTLTIFLGLIFWSWIFGPVGTVLSVPLTIVVKMMIAKPVPTDLVAAPISTPQPSA